MLESCQMNTPNGKKATIVTLAIESGPANTQPGDSILLPNRTTAVFYESPDQEGNRIAYKDTADQWSDLQTLLTDSNLESPALLCVKGVWLIYGETDFEAPTSDDVHLLSGNDNCIKPPDVSAIGAMQPVSLNEFKANSITLYSKKNFGSIGKTVAEKDIYNRYIQQMREYIPVIGSLIVTGNKTWSLISSNGHVMCIRPRPQTNLETLSICYVLDMENLIVKDFQTVAIAPDCPSEHHSSVVANLKVIDCKRFGVERIETLETGSMGRSFESALECRKNMTLNSTAFTEEQSKLIMKLVKIRLTHDFASAEQILWPDSKEDIWKTIPLDTAFDIMIATVPSDIIDVPYLTVLREFTVFHLNELWKNKEEKDKADALKEWRSHKVIVHLLNKCLKAATLQEDHYISIITSAYKENGTLSAFNDRILKSFQLNVTYDPVIETAWVVVNYAMALCHELFEYKLNFWDNFITTFHHLYFLPLEERWKTPTQISPQTFRVILSGFGVDVQYKRIAFATTVVFEETPNLQPFEKDSKFTKK